MKVLHIGEYVQGGVATYVKMLLTHPDNPDIEDFLICSSKHSEHHWPISEDHITYYPYCRSIGHIFSAMVAIQKEIRNIKPDVVYCHSTWAGLFTRFPLFFLNKSCRIIYNAHGWSFLRDTAAWKKRIYATIEQTLLLKTDVVINVSKYEYDAAVKYGLSSQKQYIIYSGITEGKVDQRRVNKFSKEQLNLLFVGRFDRPKGLDYLLENFPKCKRKDMHLYVIGDNVVDAQTPVKKKNTEQITFLGWIPHEELRSYYQACDAVILPSRWEAFGLVVIEAMKYAKPIIVSNRGALPELIENGQNGMIFNFDKPETLIAILDDLNKDDLVKMGKHAERLFIEKYEVKRMVKETIQLYKGKQINES